MKSPVYRFSDVLRALRNESGLTVLQAGEATCYANYERWESGQTRIGADHLVNIATALNVGEDLWLLVYAWLVDRFTPMPGSEPVELTGAALRRHVDALPKVEVDPGEDHAFALGALSHRDLAVVGLMARYERGYAAEETSLVLSPQERAAIPVSATRDAPVLASLYGDLMRDIGQYVARTFLLAGLNRLRGKVQDQVTRYTLLLLSEPEYLERLLASGAPPPDARGRGLNRLARLAARSAPRMRRLACRRLEELRQIEEDARGEPVTLEEVKAMIRQAARDDGPWASPAAADAMAPPDLPAVIPDPDPQLSRELRALHDQVDRAARRALAEELEDARATADPQSSFDAIRILGADRSDR